MIDLWLSIACSSILVTFFKLFGKYNIQNLQAIVVNYLTAAISGYLLFPFSIKEIISGEWMIHGIILGIVFISIFLVMALTTQKVGMAVTSIAGKMSMIVAILVGDIFLNEKIQLIQWIGITIALIAVFAISYQKERKIDKAWILLLPVILFTGSGFIDSYMFIAQKMILSKNDFVPFISTVFFFAFIGGFIYLVYEKFTSRIQLDYKSGIAGIILGLFNWGSLFFLLRALQQGSVVMIAFNNIGIVVATAFIGILIFKEKYTSINYAGIILSVLSIILLNG
jgi:drug/metabolite transporter (DMT)-like permease